ncbi:MAG TPA: hypothetical protein VFB74_32475 [Kribbellaceae bacterium]|nr:hypothetical protein [Kribbellaceae bacterium]
MATRRSRGIDQSVLLILFQTIFMGLIAAGVYIRRKVDLSGGITTFDALATHLVATVVVLGSLLAFIGLSIYLIAGVGRKESTVQIRSRSQTAAEGTTIVAEIAGRKIRELRIPSEHSEASARHKGEEPDPSLGDRTISFVIDVMSAQLQAMERRTVRSQWLAFILGLIASVPIGFLVNLFSS